MSVVSCPVPVILQRKSTQPLTPSHTPVVVNSSPWSLVLFWLLSLPLHTCPVLQLPDHSSTPQVLTTPPVLHCLCTQCSEIVPPALSRGEWPFLSACCHALIGEKWRQKICFTAVKLSFSQQDPSMWLFCHPYRESGGPVRPGEGALEANKPAVKCLLETSTSEPAVAQPALWDPQLRDCLVPEVQGRWKTLWWDWQQLQAQTAKCTRPWFVLPCAALLLDVQGTQTSSPSPCAGLGPFTNRPTFSRAFQPQVCLS